MPDEQLFRRVVKGKSVRYEPVEHMPQADEAVTEVTFTDRECITVAGSLGVVLLKLAQRNMQPHQLVARKIRAVEMAIIELFKDTGEELRIDIASGVMRCWDETMQRIANEGIDDSLIRRAQG